MSVRLRALARSNDPLCEAAAGEELAKGGSAVDAVLSGYFAAAGAYPGVLLGPVTLLIGGTGSGDRAFDGRVRQPGKNAKRPRGTLPGEEPPLAARVGRLRGGRHRARQSLLGKRTVARTARAREHLPP